METEIGPEKTFLVLLCQGDRVEFRGHSWNVDDNGSLLIFRTIDIRESVGVSTHEYVAQVAPMEWVYITVSEEAAKP